MDQQTLDLLAKNIKRDGKLESVPLVVDEGDGKFAIVSGHHRVEASEKAGIEKIIVMVTEVENVSHLRAKQLAHNALVGQDDEVVLKKLYESIESIEDKLYSGLQDKLDSVNIASLSFRAGNFKEFVVAFLPEDVEAYDQVVEEVDQMTFSGSSDIRLATMKTFDQFAKAIRQVKKAENIKSNGAALFRVIELAKERLAQMEEERQLQEAAAGDGT